MLQSQPRFGAPAQPATNSTGSRLLGAPNAANYASEQYPQEEQQLQMEAPESDAYIGVNGDMDLNHCSENNRDINLNKGAAQSGAQISCK